MKIHTRTAFRVLLFILASNTFFWLFSTGLQRLGFYVGVQVSVIALILLISRGERSES